MIQLSQPRQPRAGLLCAVLLATALPVAGLAADAADVAAFVGREPIARADIDAAVAPAIEKAEREHATEVRQLDFELALKRAALVEAEVSQRLDDRVLALEAAATHLSRTQLLARLPAEPITDAAVRAFYDQHRGELNQPFERVSNDLRTLLADQARSELERAYLKSLRAKYHASSRIEPLRFPIDPTGPGRGPPEAPVMIVEFADFQCPFCAQMEPVIAEVIASYPREVRVVFRHLPLESLHPLARGAARAAVCARRQDHFWEMHDALFAHQSALADESLKATARRLGLDGAAFDACLRDGHPETEVDADVVAAEAAGIAATPAFLVNGRFVSGTVPAATLKDLIDDELDRRHRTGQLRTAGR